jgi:hypothetical protein
MNTRGMYLVGMLVILFLANIAMLMGMTNWPKRIREGFAADVASGKKMVSGTSSYTVPSPMDIMMKTPAQAQAEHFADMKHKKVEGFTDMLSNGFATASIGPYDGKDMTAGLPAAAQGFRGNHSNEPLNGPPVTIDGDHLFYFANNQCKPECCGATLSCSGGCVCTTPEQRDFINTRGNNRKHDDGF